MFNKKVALSNCTLQISADTSLDSIIGYGSRINKKRSFLFVSKVLGKHIPVSPKKMLSTHKKLAGLINPEISNDHLLVIGLAETATGLGWGVFEALNASTKFYIHTTRVKLKQKQLIQFEEAHSHATEQYLYFPISPKFKIESINHIIIIDDEITTGNTIGNLIQNIKAQFPKCTFSILTLLNWKNYKKSYKVYALKEGSFTSKEQVHKANLKVSKKETKNELNELPIVKQKKTLANTLANGFGRVGAFSYPELNQTIIRQVKKIKNKSILLLGTGEFMHYPLVISKYFCATNKIKIQSTSRSPVEIGGAIKSKLSFRDNYYPEVNNYLYNVANKKYDIVFIFYESKTNKDHLLIDQLKQKFNKVIPIYI